MDTCICVAESLRCSPETITTLLISYIPIQNIKLKKRESARPMAPLASLPQDLTPQPPDQAVLSPCPWSLSCLYDSLRP